MLTQRRGVIKQKGAALVVSLVVLSVVTVLSVMSMKSSTLDLKLAATMRDQALAFEAAEAALSMVERDLASNPPALLSLVSDCFGPNCYDATCTEGRCFSGRFDSGDERIYCELSNDPPSIERLNFWDDPVLDVWNDSSKHRTVIVSGVTSPVKYITEFLCFVKRDAELPFNALTEANKMNGSPLFRVTVLAQGRGRRSTVSLQSTYRL